MSAHTARISGERPALAAALTGWAAEAWPTLAVAGAIVAICFAATGGVLSIQGSPGGAELAPNTLVQMLLTIVGGLLVALSFAREREGRVRVFGLGAAVALFALGAFTALSVNWSVAPANSWLEADRTFSYAATFAGALALVRLAPGRWRSIVGGVLLATLVIAGYAVASKIAPAALDAGDTSARLSVPLGYWNAVGLTAALGLCPALWLGSRREGHGALAALAAPALCVLLVTLVLSYSRGAVLAAAVGVALWFAFVPLRLRAAALLAIGGLAAAAVSAWTFAQPALANDNVALAARSAAGRRLGLILLAALVLAFAAALLLRFAGDRGPLSAPRRRRLGIVLLVGLALVPVAGVGAAAHSSRGLFGTISHAWYQLTTPNARQPSNSANRLTATGSMQALYWSYALDVFDANPIAGAGGGSYGIAYQRFMTGPAAADNAHGYVFETLADLGLIGLALSLAVAFGWGFAAVRTLGPLRPRAPSAARRPLAPADGAERIGLLTLAAVVITFTVHSAVDWTYFVPGDAVVALLCAGWIAGRGPLREARAPRPITLARLRRSPLAAAGAASAVVLALIIAWAQWQPLRSEQASTAGSLALGAAAAAPFGSPQAARDIDTARIDELAAVSRDPLDITPLINLAGAYLQDGEVQLAQQTLERAVALQPSNAASWFALWELDSGVHRYAKVAARALAVTFHLYPYEPGLEKRAIERS